MATLWKDLEGEITTLMKKIQVVLGKKVDEKYDKCKFRMVFLKAQLVGAQDVKVGNGIQLKEPYHPNNNLIKLTKSCGIPFPFL